jgi:hypothetical protein
MLCISLHCVLGFGRPGRVRLYLIGAQCGDDDVLFACVCRSGYLTALSGMTGMQTLYLSNNHLIGAFRKCCVCHCIPCCDLSTGTVRVYLAGAPCGDDGVLFVCVSRRQSGGLVGYDRHAELVFTQQPVDRRVSVVLCISLHSVLSFVNRSVFGCTWLALRVLIMVYCLFVCVAQAI